ncbi:MAG: SusC/RagA family TonB-linked outer membrane protein, partial [Saprospiraceae bacterium]
MKIGIRHFLSKCLLLLLMVGVSSFAMAQTVKGTVTDAVTGEALIGANVLVKGTDVGGITDLEGKYTVNVPEGGTTLVFSYTGYSNKEVSIDGRSVVDAQLNEGIDVNEMVVVGYGSVKKSDATGAVTAITSKDFNKGVVASPEQLIQGRAAGVQITASSGEPGAGMNIRIRGTSSVRAGNNPLIVVDGVPLSGGDVTAGGNTGQYGSSAAKNPLNFLNPNDIASIDILKDASATAIYGSRGANGVILITTKSGKGQKGVLDYSYNLGISQISKKYDLLDRQGFLDAYTEINGATAAANIDAGGNTDWQDEIFRTAFTNSHNVSFGDGDASGNYRFSLGYQDQQGIVKGTGLKRLSARFNANKSFVDDKVKIGVQATIANTNDEQSLITDDAGFEGDLLGNILKARPTNPVYRFNEPDSGYFQQSTTELNPVAMNELSRSITSNLRALGSVSGEVALTSDLKFKSVLGFDRSTSSRVDAFSGELLAAGIDNGKGRLFMGDLTSNNTLWENYFTYDRDMGDVSLNALAGYSYQRFDNSGKNFEATNFRETNLDLITNNLGAADQGNGTSLVGNSFRNIDELQSYFGRVNIGFKGKYLFTGTLRADGSTRFGSDNAYGYFPSAAFKWRLIEEGFIPETFSDLSLRVGYGVTGNQELPHNVYTARTRYNDWSINNDGNNIEGGGLGNVAFANPDLKWESTSQLNVGVDYGFMDGRINGSLDYYFKNTNDLLFLVQSAQPAAQPFVWENLDADVINQGVELSVNVVAVDNDNFSWNVNANAAYNQNVVRNFGGNVNTAVISGQGLTGAFAQRISNDQPLFAYYLRDFAGYNDAGVSEYNDGDFQQFLGKSPLPKWNLGLTNTFNVGNFDATIFFSSQLGQYVYNNTANAFFTAGALASGKNVTTDVPTNGESNLNAPDVSTRFLENASFLRL